MLFKHWSNIRIFLFTLNCFQQHYCTWLSKCLSYKAQVENKVNIAGTSLSQLNLSGVLSIQELYSWGGIALCNFLPINSLNLLTVVSTRQPRSGTILLRKVESLHLCKCLFFNLAFLRLITSDYKKYQKCISFLVSVPLQLSSDVVGKHGPYIQPVTTCSYWSKCSNVSWSLKDNHPVGALPNILFIKWYKRKLITFGLVFLHNVLGVLGVFQVDGALLRFIQRKGALLVWTISKLLFNDLGEYIHYVKACFLSLSILYFQPRLDELHSASWLCAGFKLLVYSLS